MSSYIYRHRFLWLRRISQLVILFLFIGAQMFGWKILVGDLSSAHVFDSFYMSDP